MGLERIYLYHVVRVLRVLLPVLVVVLAGVFWWNYTSRSERSPDVPEPHLEENVVNATEGFSSFQAGDDCYVLHSEKNLGFEGGINQLEAVVVRLVCEGSSERELRASRCGVRNYDELVIGCEGGVEVDLDPRTRIRTEALGYDSSTGTITSQAVAEVRREGEFVVHAARLSLRMRDRVLRLTGGVDLLRDDGTRIRSDDVTYDEAAGHVSAVGAVRLKAANMELEGARGQVWLEDETRAPRRIEMRGDVRALSLVPAQPGSLTASELDADVEGGAVRLVRARGDVVFDSGMQSVSGDAVTAALDPEVGLTSLEAIGGARMRLDTGESIRSTWIRQTGTEAIRTRDESVLEAGDAVIRGSEFSIDRGSVVRFTTSKPATITSTAGVFEGNSTEALFDANTSTLIQLEQTGDARFEAGDRSGTAGRIEIDEAWIVLSGNARAEDEDFTLEGEVLRMKREEDALEADGDVFLMVRDESGPVFLEADHLEGSRGDTLHFEGSALLRRAGGQVSADRIDAEPDRGAFSAYGDVVSTTDDMIVHSAVLHFDDTGGRVEYSGQVRARSPQMTLDSEFLELTLVDETIDRVDATSEVRVLSPEGLQGFGASATWLRSEDELTLRGPGAEAIDATHGRCRGNEIVIDLVTQNVNIQSGTGGRAVCSPAPERTGRD
jgi:lipopolysaccharide export system protein LptA